MTLVSGGLTSAALHLIAMVAMLCDHIWAAGLGNGIWLTAFGRIAFPIFAFLLAEGFHHSSSRKKYARRLALFALISEIPFNLIAGGGMFYPFHQNIYCTLLLGFGAMALNEKAKRSGSGVLRVVAAVLTAICGYLFGYLFFVDYFGAGVLTILVFYFFRERTPLNCVAQLLALYYINFEMLGGLVYEFSFLGMELTLAHQGIALAALPLIWLYNGQRGHQSRAFQYFCYAFYPAHLLLLYLLARFL